MKLTWFLILALTLQTSASLWSQTTNMSVRLNNSTLLELFTQIEKNSEYRFFYNNDEIDVSQKITVIVDDKSIGEILASVFNGLPYSFKEKEDNLILIERTKANNESGENVLQQQNPITGKVTDKSGDPLPGVSVIIKGTTQGTITNSNGEFLLSSIPENATLVFSFVGMKMKEISIGGKTIINVEMEEMTFGVGEVVVTALGIERSKKSLNYATEMVDMQLINTAKDINLGNALSGKVAGVTVTTSTGSNGVSGDALIVIRGNRSINNNNQPLIVVDGVPYSTGGGGLTGINSDDVQSMNVLKGSSASALYGSAAANGVIVVTTKKGKKGIPKIEINSSTTFDIPYLYPELQNEYAQGAAGVYNPNVEYYSWGPKMAGQTVTSWTGKETTLDPQPDNFKDFFKTGCNFINSFAYSTGTENSTTYFSYSNTTARGILADNKMQRHNFNLRLETQLLDKLKMDVKLTYFRQDVKDKPLVGDDLFGPMLNLMKMPRSMRTEDIKNWYYYDEAGSLKQNSWYPKSTNNLNPYFALYGYAAPSSTNTLNSFISLRYDLTKSFYIQARGGLISGGDDSEKKTYWSVSYVNAGHGNYNTSFSKWRTYNGDILLSYNESIGKDFSLSLNAGAEIRDSYGRSIYANSGGLTVENKFSLDYAEALTTDDGESRIQKQAVYGFGQLSYREYLFLDITARNDWSSTLPSPYRYFYPSVGLTGIISDMVELPDFVSFAKIRGSYAEVGNDAPFASTLQTYESIAMGPAGVIKPQSTRIAVNLIPEKSKSWEAGAELKLLDNRLGIDFTWYKSNTYNQLVRITSVASGGYSNSWVNCGNIQNSGVELMLYAKPIKTTDFTWDLGLNFTRNKNKVINLSEKIDKYQIDSPNMSIGECWVLKDRPYGELYTRGFVRNDDGKIIVDNLGMPKVQDDELTYLGNFNYDWRAGLTNTLNYKNWNLSFLIDLNYGGVRGSASESWMLACGTSKASLVGREEGIIIDGVKEDGSVNNLKIDAESYYRSIGGRLANGACGELFSHDATNSRLREFSLGYTFPLKSKLIKSLDISAVGRNLFYIYNGCKWFDPDVTYDVNTNGQGAESAFLPGTRTLGFNIKVTF